MLKLVTDPRVFPVREVDLSGANDSVAAVPSLADLVNRNLTFDRPDGGRNLIFRPRRASIQLDLNLVPGETRARLAEIAGLSRQNRTRALCLVAPNLDSSTILYAPLASSMRYWRRDPASGAMVIASSSSSSFVDDRYQIDDDGFLSKVPAGSARFESNGLVRGLRVDHNFANLCSPSLPTSGALLWSAGAGSPALAFDSMLESPVRGRTGALAIRSTAATGASQWFYSGGITGSAFNARLFVVEFLRGNGLVSLGMAQGGGSVSFSPAFQLRPDRFVPVWHSIPTDASSTSFSILNSLTGSGSLQEIVQGPVHAYQTGSLDLVARGVHSWSEVATDSHEWAILGPIRFPRDFSFSFVGTVPLETTATQKLLILDGLSNSYIEWRSDGPAMLIGGSSSGSLGLTAQEWADNAGRPFVFLSTFD